MDEENFPARVEDAYSLCSQKNIPRFLGFLTPAETAVADGILKKYNARYEFFGGYEGAERQMLCVMPEWCDEPEYPIITVSFKYKPEYSLSHRDFLGAVMALGINRESIGDILVTKGSAVMLLKDRIAPYVISQITKVGSVGVDVKLGYDGPIEAVCDKTEHSGTVSSLRVDCVLSLVCRCSRASAAELIDSGRVSINSKQVLKHTVLLAGGDGLTVRGKGRFDINGTDELSKKGRTIINYSRYR